MVSIPTLCLLFVTLFANDVQARENPSNIIKLGSSLSPKGNPTSWVSVSGLFAFGFYRQGNGFAIGIWLIGKSENIIVWTANRDNPPVSSDSTLELNASGQLLLQTGKESQELFTGLQKSAVSASMLDSGNFVLYGKDLDVLWQSFAIPTDTILGGQNLSSGGELVSGMSKSEHSSGHFILSMQPDGNLVAYPVNNSMQQEDAYWASETFGGHIRLSLSRGGFLWLRDDQNSTFISVLVNSTNLGKKATIVYRATLDEDGIFRLYEHQFEKNTSSSVKIVWRSLSSPCEVKGSCGFNSYCSTINGSAVCQCFPGFVPFKRSNMFLDCEQNYSRDDCETNEDPVLLYDVTSLQDMWLGDDPYLVLTMEMEACGKSCREDCNCGAASYSNGNCHKYKLPLIYGRIQVPSATAFFKLPSGNIITPNHTIPFPGKPKVLVDNKRKLILILVLTLGSISFFSLVFAMSIFFIYRRRVYSYTKLCGSANLGFNEECSLRTFSFDELVDSTGGFSEEVGRGYFGAVYRGTISGTNRRIAVKKLDNVVDEGEREFQAEITAIARTHHKNLVQLIGFCIDGSRKLLVYEYMNNGSLADLLFKAEMRLSWKQRVKIALDVARGVLYLHEECEVCIVHCNIKPQNILMDEAWTAKISDFGLARLVMPEHSRTTTGNEVTSGYLAPERQKDASVSVKADIYSYGVVLMEVICCRRNIDVEVSSEEEIILSSWVYKCFVAGELNKLVADEDVEWRTMERMVKVGLWCVQEDPSLRPSMKNVMLMLEGLKEIPIPLPPSPAPPF